MPVILIRCGLRVGDAARLPFSWIVTDADGAPYLRYYSHKMKREALVPSTRNSPADHDSNSGRWGAGQVAVRPRSRPPGRSTSTWRSASTDRAATGAGCGAVTSATSTARRSS